MPESRGSLSVGFVGLGEIGAPMARRIVDAGWPLAIYARRPQALESFRDTPAVIAQSLRELGERAGMVAVCVHDDAQVLQVALGDGDGGGAGFLAGMREGGIIVIHSTVSRDTCQRVAEAAGKRGIEVLDAPISGGCESAGKGELCVMVGGQPAPFERCKPVLESFGRMVSLLGPLGSGQAAKCINNALYAAQGRLVHEAVQFGARLGLDRRALLGVMQAGSSDSFVLRRYAITSSLQYWHTHRGSAVGNAVNVLEKDAALFGELAAATGADPGHLHRLAEQFVQALRTYGREGRGAEAQR